MKKIIFSFLMIAAFAQTNANTTTTPTFEDDFLFRKVLLNAGTLVLLETGERVFSDDVTIGQTVQYRVKTNVIADGKVVITTGSLAIGRVKSIKETTYNGEEEITIEVTSVQAVDGQQVALNGFEQTFKGQFSGEGTSVQSGRTITANVMNDILIKIN